MSRVYWWQNLLFYYTNLPLSITQFFLINNLFIPVYVLRDKTKIETKMNVRKCWDGVYRISGYIQGCLS